MTYWKIILFSFFIGFLSVVAGLLVLHTQQSQAVRHHPANDMVGLAYGLAIGFNIVLALCSLPVLALKRRKAPKLWPSVALLFGLPLIFTIYVTWAMDIYALLYCLPYLCSVAVLVSLRIARRGNIRFRELKTGDPAGELEIGAHEITSGNYLRLHVCSGINSCGSIDFIGEKINFNIVDGSFFKGMEAIRNVGLAYREGKLIFTFRNRKNLEFRCAIEAFEAVHTHVGIYKNNIKYS
ncbi:hypothetical protein [Niabella drilacis]|uniref:Uncharacterized protein n=1 Tax=Niabella drilacis (strain DSM 25811 / CCM 8410 / CCUG 62505 / LMG 26954 / E90) TaxID=1285928 RepID=A0A1G6TC59_NIADE|nr:hypothetical protein [Niabella drilacis]SDD26722.1 hypothetical protein SAMN04487894_107169 [Niabella drilacis]